MYGYVYDTIGYITKIVQAATEESVRLEMGDGEKFILSDTMFNEETYYISGTTPTLRPSFSLSLSKSTMTAGTTDYINLVGVPSGATVTLSRVGASKTVTADGTTIQIKTPLPGEYTVTVEKFPYRNGVVNFVATAST